MSLSFVKTPEAYNMVYNKNNVYYEASSDLYAQTNYRYIFKIYEHDLSTHNPTLLSTHKIFPNLSGNAQFNPCPIIKNYLTSDFSGATLKNVECLNSHGLFSCDLSEEYGDPVASGRTTTGITFYFWNGCDQYESYLELYPTYNYYLLTNKTQGHYLIPTNKYYLDNKDYMFLYFIYDIGDKPTKAMFNWYNGIGFSVTMTHTFVTGTTYNSMYLIPCGPANLPSGITLLTDWNYYTINIENDVGDIYNAETITIYRKNKCDLYEYIQVFWLNSLGGWSNFTFYKKKTTSYKMNRKSYDKFLPYGYSIGDYGAKNYYNNIDETITLTTDWINVYENKLIESLFMSNDVRIQTTLNNKIYYIPYIVVDDGFDPKEPKYDGMFIYNIQFKKSVKKITQY